MAVLSLFLRPSCQLILTILCLVQPVWAVNIISNGDFSAGLTSWNAGGDLSVASGVASLGDNCGMAGGNPCSRLYQLVALDSGDYTLEFDIDISQIQASNTIGTFPDVLFGSLYYALNTSFDIDTLNFASVDDLFDADSSGANFFPGVLSSTSLLGPNWIHVMYSFSTISSIYVAPAFEFFDLDFQTGSKVLVDNVAINKNSPAVPEPGTMLLLLSGTFALRRGKRKLQA